MRLYLSLLLLGIFISAANGQQRTSVVSKVTASWCPNCGTWGWDFFDSLKSVYENDNKATLLGVHHSGDLRNPVSSWFANNLEFRYQPQFYHNNEDIDVSRNNWDDKISELQDLVDVSSAGNPLSNFSFVNAFVENDEIVCNMRFDASSKAVDDFYFAIYVFENNVENFQSSRGMSSHPNVLRDVMMDDPQGEIYEGADESGNVIYEKEYRMALDNNWNPDNIGLLAIMWQEENGQFIYDNASSIHNIGMLSSTDTFFEEDAFTVTYANDGIQISSELTSTFNVRLYDMNARLVSQVSANTTAFISTENMPAGLYAIHIHSKGKTYSQQVFVGR